MTKRLFFVNLLISNILTLFVVQAQSGNSSFIHYTTDQGLSNDYIKDILKDRQGFLWIATQNGLNRFDGHSFRQFFHDPENTNSLPGNLVKHLTLDHDGFLWATCENGICRIDPATLIFNRFYLPENRDASDQNDQTGRVVFDEVGMGWVSAKNALHCFDPVSGDVHSYPMELEEAGSFTTYYDRTGKIWLIENQIISYFDTHTSKLRILPTDTPGNPLAGAAPLNICEDLQGKLWVTTWFKGLAWYDPVLDSLLDYPDDKTLTSVILLDKYSRDGTSFWLGGGKYGLFYFDPVTGNDIQFPIDPRDAFTHNNYIATALFSEGEMGSLWVGTEAGLEHYSPASLRFDRVILPIDISFGQFSLMSGAVQDMTDPSGNSYYIAMWGSGLFSWDRRRNQFEHLHAGNSGLKNNGLFCVMQDSNGMIWMGSEGISRLDPRTGKWKNWGCFSKRINESLIVMSCIEDKQGGLWFGTNRGGLFWYNPLKDKMEEVELPPKAYSAEGRLRIRNMHLDEEGMIWMATTNFPIRFDPATRKASVFQISNEKYRYNNWTDVHLAKSGLLYATSHDCLLEMDTQGVVLRKFDQNNGLRSNQVYFIEEDRKGHLWLNTTFLLHCLDPQTGRFNYFGTSDGLFKNTITDGLVMMPNGEIFIGFQNAFNYFNPESLPRNEAPPPVAITSIKVMGKERQPVGNEIVCVKPLFSRKKCYHHDSLLILYPGDEIFTLQFAALNFNQPSRNRYAFMLEGFNEDWVYTNHNFATYTNLDGGEYLFRVKAANNDGVWNEAGTSVLVKVIPPLTERWYFQLMMALLALLILLGIWYYRHQQRLRLGTFQENLARDLHDEMGSTLSSIRFFSEYAKTQIGPDKPEVVAILQRIILSASALSESMQDIVWAMRQNNDQLEDLGVRMTEFGLRMFEARNVQFKAHIGNGFSGKSLSPEMRRNLYLIFKEAVNNAAKYAAATEVELFLSVRKGLLLMKLTDNGQGFDAQDPPSEVMGSGGNGLQNMTKRAEEIGGSLEIVSNKNEGTNIIVRLRI